MENVLVRITAETGIPSLMPGRVFLAEKKPDCRKGEQLYFVQIGLSCVTIRESECELLPES